MVFFIFFSLFFFIFEQTRIRNIIIKKLRYEREAEEPSKEFFFATSIFVCSKFENVGNSGVV